jgi:hypothetical protein
MNLDPEQILNLFAKSVNVSGYAGAIPNSLLARQDLEAEIIKLTNRNTPLRDIIKRTRGEGRAHLWNQRKSLGQLPTNNSPLEVFFPDGGLPTESDPIYLQKTAKPYMWPSLKTSLYRGTLTHACDMPIPRQPARGALETSTRGAANQAVMIQSELAGNRKSQAEMSWPSPAERQQMAYAYLGVSISITGPMLKKFRTLLASLNLAISVELRRIFGQYRANPLCAVSA